MKKTENKHLSAKIISLILALLMLFAFAACKKEEVTEEEKNILWSDATYTSDTTLGEGENHFTFKVTAGDKSVNFKINTDKEILGEALQELDLISGDEGDYGLYVKYVNGIYADYEETGAYWAFHINGEMAMSGVDMTEIEDGASYEMQYTKG